jgi:hypothetical protein
VARDATQMAATRLVDVDDDDDEDVEARDDHQWIGNVRYLAAVRREQAPPQRQYARHAHISLIVFALVLWGGSFQFASGFVHVVSFVSTL